MKNNNKGLTPIELMIALVSMMLTVMCFININVRPGTGEKIGQIVKINTQGIFNDTLEAELIRGGLNAGSGSFGSAPFHFTIEKNWMARQAKEFMENQTEVIIRYRMEGVYSRFRSDSSGHFLVSIEPANKK